MKKEWISHFFEQCAVIAKKSKDPSTKVAAIAVSPKSKWPKGTGFNGFPIGVEDDPQKVPERYEKPEKYLWTCHAEQNLIALAARYGVALEGCVMFCNLQTCVSCTALIIQAGIVEVYCRSDEGTGDWRKDLPVSKTMYREAGVKLYVFDEFGRCLKSSGTESVLPWNND